MADDEALDAYVDRIASSVCERTQLELDREGADPARALELVNSAREALGHDPLGVLPVAGSVRGSIGRCVVASTWVNLPTDLSLLALGFDFGLLEPEDPCAPCDPRSSRSRFMSGRSPIHIPFDPEAWRDHRHGGWWPVDDPRMTLNLFLIGMSVAA